MDNEISQEESKISLTSRKKWFWVGLIITLLNPIFSGLIISSAFLSEPELKREGKILVVLAVVWGLILFFLILPILYEKFGIKA